MDSRPHFTNGRRAASSIDRVSGDERYRSLVEAINDYAIFLLDADGYVATWNGGAQRIKGYLPDEIIGRPISILAPPDRPDEIPGIMERIRRGQPVSHLETVRVRKDGTPLNVSITVSPIRDAAGEVRGASTIARDITAQKRAEAALRGAGR